MPKEGTRSLLSSSASFLGLLVVFCFLVGISGREACREINPVQVENGSLSLLGSRVIRTLLSSPGKLLRDLEYKTGEHPKGCSQFTSHDEYRPHRDSECLLLPPGGPCSYLAASPQLQACSPSPGSPICDRGLFLIA